MSNSSVGDPKKIQEYTERYKDWRNITVNQLSITNNVLLTLTSGFFVVCIDKNIFKDVTFNTSHICWYYTIYMISMLFLTISILFGIFVLFSRLYDFRISRHIAMIRKRAYLETEVIKFADYQFERSTMNQRWIALWTVIFGELDFVQESDRGEKRILKFHKLRQFTRVLGEASWKWTKVQVGMFFIAVIIYLISLFLQP